jgi:predicted ATPase/DNA-binding CsgD family transcriptional regulator
MDERESLPFESPAEKLSWREQEVLALLAEHLTNREIAGRLHLAESTIKEYVGNILGKLYVKNRRQAVERAKELGLLEPEEQAVLEMPGNLPAPVTSFIGRRAELAHISSLLKEPSIRLLTLTGPPGTGKTRLSLEVAFAAAGNYAHGVNYVALAPTTDPVLVPNIIANELGVVERPNRPLVESLQRYLGGKQMLMVLDNFEHVLEAAPLLTQLLASAPRLAVLVTSREVLRLSGEHEYLVPPLTIPQREHIQSVQDMMLYESVALFSQRARAASTNFRLTDENAQAVADICVRLDGLPLAIELAAARVKIYSPQQILERLESRLGLLTGGARDLPVHQRTLRATIDWSYNLLEEGEQQLFSRLAVFNGGRTIEAVEAVCGPGLPIEATAGLESLLDKSLLFKAETPGGEPRFIMLETIHEYARERLAESGEESLIRDQHLDYFRELAEEMEPGYRRHNQLFLMERTEVEMANLRAAFDWAIESGNYETGARLVAAMDYFLFYGEHAVEAYQWINQLIGEIDAMSPEIQVRVLSTAGRIAWVNGDLSRSKSLRQKDLILAQQLGDKHTVAWSMIHLAMDSVNRLEENAEAVKLCEEGLAILRELDDKPGIAQALNNLGELARAAGDYDRAGEVYEECLEICLETGEIIRQIMLLGNLAFVAYQKEDYGRARTLSQGFMKQSYEIGAMQLTVTGMAALAGSLSRLGEEEKGAQLLGASAALIDEMGVDHHPSDLDEIARYTTQIRSQLDETTFESYWAMGEAMTMEEAVAHAADE